jgi:hypothetical protein
VMHGGAGENAIRDLKGNRSISGISLWILSDYTQGSKHNSGDNFFWRVKKNEK